MAKKNPTVKSLRQGQTVFYVTALGANSYITQYLLMDKPYLEDALDICEKKEDRLFISAKLFSETINELIESEFSLKDCNVVPNRYNRHRLFYSKGKAKTYCQKCIDENIDLVRNDA
jgi:hypothetical protein